jgi:hypothetical protein
MAAEATGRRAALIELDSRYCDVIVRRWQEGTGGEARLEADGRSFAQLAAERLGESPSRPEAPDAAVSASVARSGPVLGIAAQP